MPIRTNPDGPDLPQTAVPVAVEDNPNLPKLEAPKWGKVETRIHPPIPCNIRGKHGGRHRAQIVGMANDSGIAPPASFVCRSCQHAFDDPAQEGIAPALVKCPKCKKKGVQMYPASVLGARSAVKGGAGVTVYLVQRLEAETEELVDDPNHPGKKVQRTVLVDVPVRDRAALTLTADKIELT